MQGDRRARPPVRRDRAGWLTVAAFASAALAVIELHQPAQSLLKKPFETLAVAQMDVSPSADAFGTSGEVKLRVVLPGERVEYPLEVEGDPSPQSLMRFQFTNGAAGGRSVVARQTGANASVNDEITVEN